jgi:hypothetical protein
MYIYIYAYSFFFFFLKSFRADLNEDEVTVVTTERGAQNRIAGLTREHQMHLLRQRELMDQVEREGSMDPVGRASSHASVRPHEALVEENENLRTEIRALELLLSNAAHASGDPGLHVILEQYEDVIESCDRCKTMLRDLQRKSPGLNIDDVSGMRTIVAQVTARNRYYKKDYQLLPRNKSPY